jgi:two-component system, OmpR family, sensor histidine kinase TctE
MRQPSLRFLLLRWLLPALLAVLLAGAATAYWVALRSATKAYDRALLDTALAIVEQLAIRDGRPVLPLTAQAREVLLVDKFDQIFFAVRGPDGELLDGEPGLPMPSPRLPREVWSEGRYYFDGRVNDKPVRVAALRAERGGKNFTVLAGETLVKRNALVREILLGMLLPELLLIAACLTVVWFGVRSGLKPLARLRDELAGRSQADLRPVTTGVPEEIQPVVNEINGVLDRLGHSLDTQRYFVSDAAHQLRTPIAALQAQVEATLAESDPLLRHKLHGILAAAHRLSHLVEQMLMLARAQPSLALAQTQTRVALAEVAQAAAEDWLPLAIANGIDLGFELAPGGIFGNRLLLQEVFANLLDNALRHTPRGGSVNVRCGAEETGVWLAVEDSGPGIPEADREKVFERFYQAPGSSSRGCGLGLSIVREIARQHGGQAVIDRSPELGGARVTVRFALA